MSLVNGSLFPDCIAQEDGKHHHVKVLFSSFPKNDHTEWFDIQTKKLEPHCITKQTAPHEDNC